MRRRVGNFDREERPINGIDFVGCVLNVETYFSKIKIHACRQLYS